MGLIIIKTIKCPTLNREVISSCLEVVVKYTEDRLGGVFPRDIQCDEYNEKDKTCNIKLKHNCKTVGKECIYTEDLKCTYSSWREIDDRH